MRVESSRWNDSVCWPANRFIATESSSSLTSVATTLSAFSAIGPVWEDVLEAAVYIICWDLGIRAGVDLLEEIRVVLGGGLQATLQAQADYVAQEAGEIKKTRR